MCWDGRAHLLGETEKQFKGMRNNEWRHFISTSKRQRRTEFKSLINLLIHFSDRLDVVECLNHKWLADEADQNEERLLDILAEQTTNVIVTISPNDNKITETTESLKRVDSELKVEVPEADEEEKENSIIKEPINISRHPTIACPSLATKLVLEKSLSLSMFPDAPTTPKVSRKMIYDDEDDLNSQVKEIVKKYQTNEGQHHQQKRQACCNSETIGECVLCKSKSPTKKPPSLELDKGIIC